MRVIEEAGRASSADGTTLADRYEGAASALTETWDWSATPVEKGPRVSSEAWEVSCAEGAGSKGRGEGSVGSVIEATGGAAGPGR